MANDASPPNRDWSATLLGLISEWWRRQPIMSSLLYHQIFFLPVVVIVV